MRDFTVQVPSFLRQLMPHSIWRKQNTNSVFLTFDDGPIPEVTPRVLEILRTYKVTATFFCVADNVRKYPHIYQEILDSGMSVGNHTYHHLNGWKTPFQDYVDDVEKASLLIRSELFRPPYGRITPKQRKRLSQSYKLIMWDVLTKDYAPLLNVQDCFENIKKYTRPGSIIVFHDSLKAKNKLDYLLPKTIEFLQEKGFKLTSKLK